MGGVCCCFGCLFVFLCNGVMMVVKGIVYLVVFILVFGYVFYGMCMFVVVFILVNFVIVIFVCVVMRGFCVWLNLYNWNVLF